jgi:hypothetical protein
LLTLRRSRAELAIVCEPCGRRGRYIARLIAAHGADAKLTDLLVTLANCEKARSFSVYDRCKAVYEGLVVFKEASLRGGSGRLSPSPLSISPSIRLHDDRRPSLPGQKV